MTLKFFLALVFIAAQTSFAHAELPLKTLEQLRRATIITRVASDGVGDAQLSKCGKIQIPELGAKLQLLKSNLEAEWAEIKLSAEDLALLSERIQICEKRASCMAYESYLGNVQVASEAKAKSEQLLENLEEKLENMTAKTYLAALATIEQPCAELQRLKATK